MNKQEKALKAFFGESLDVKLDDLNSCREGNIATLCMYFTDSKGYTWGTIAFEVYNGYNRKDVEQSAYLNSSLIACIGNFSTIAYNSYIKYGKKLDEHRDEIYISSYEENTIKNYTQAAGNGLIDTFQRLYGTELMSKIVETAMEVDFYSLNEVTILKDADSVVKVIAHKYLASKKEVDFDDYYLNEVEKLKTDDKLRKVLLKLFNTRTHRVYLEAEVKHAADIV